MSTTKNPLQQLFPFGQSWWLDNLTPELIAGGLSKLVSEDGLRGVTSNPSIFQKAIAGGATYKARIAALAATGLPPVGIYEALAVEDVRGACDALRKVWDETDGLDGYVSLEVSPYLAHDTDGTVAEAKRLAAAVDRPNLFIKIPGTAAGVRAIEETIAAGIPVNVTLLFSVESWEAIAWAYVRGLERRAASGGSLRVASVASFFLSRIDTLVDQLLAPRIRAGSSAASFLSSAAVANAKLAYAAFEKLLGDPRWKALEAKGARVQRMLWASTSTKDPLLGDVRYVEPLIGPHTVNTLPDETVAAFRDHGVAADTVRSGIAEAQAVMDGIRELGIDFHAATVQLESEGVQKFIDAFDLLIGSVAEERAKLVAPRLATQKLAPAGLAKAHAAALSAMTARQASRRLWSRDPLLYSASPEHAKVVANRLGWLDSPAAFLAKAAELSAFAAEVKAAGIAHVVHVGMGGSSLCPEVCRDVFGSAPGFPELIVLDSTDPDAVTAVEGKVDLLRTLVIVASKSGGTIETASFAKRLWQSVKEKAGKERGDLFVAITDPGSPLAADARAKGYRRVFENPADIGGRYSALSYFGLVPMALLGIDVAELLSRAVTLAGSAAPELPPAKNGPVELGILLGGAARAGRDKLTFLSGRELSPFGAWAEQLVAESTGKEGHGVLPVDDEPAGTVESYGKDRVFASLTLAGGDRGPEAILEALEKAGHPVVRLELPDRLALGAEFLRWEIATALAGAVLGVDPFDEPNVGESKKNTAALLDRWKAEKSFPGEPTEFAISTPGGGEETIGGVLDLAGPPRYVSILAYFRRTDPRHARLEEIRRTIRDRRKLATTLGYGPRYLHSTGQLHKGGPADGIFLVLTADPATKAAIPGEEYGFETLVRAQGLGDLEALARRGRRVFRVHLGSDVEAGLDRLAKTVS